MNEIDYNDKGAILGLARQLCEKKAMRFILRLEGAVLKVMYAAVTQSGYNDIADDNAFPRLMVSNPAALWCDSAQIGDTFHWNFSSAREEMGQFCDQLSFACAKCLAPIRKDDLGGLTLTIPESGQ